MTNRRNVWLRGGLLCLAALMLAPACQESPESGRFQGYVEAELTYLASPFGGRLDTLAVRRGQNVKAGALVFGLEAQSEKAALDEAMQMARQAKDRLADLQKGLRPSELAAIQARLDSAQSNLRLARLELARRQRLYRGKSIPKAELDKARNAFRDSQARVDQLTAEVKTGRLGGREDAVAAARAEAAARSAAVEKARWAFEQKWVSAPAAGLVFDTFYTPGEWVSPARPVAALLTPGNLKVRFFVPQAVAGSLKLGQTVALACDGCQKGLRGAINYISPQAEYTPPVIYSQSMRAKLVFMVEAKPEPAQAMALHPGQPMDVSLAAQKDAP